LETENAQLRRRVARAEAELAKARKMIEVRGTYPRFWESCSSQGREVERSSEQ
jgi:hypothetical protein